MSAEDLPGRPDGTGREAGNLVRAWRRRISRRDGAPESELPALRAALEAVGISIDALEHDAETATLRIEYATPDGVPPERGVELVTTALLATHDSGEWADGGVEAIDAAAGVTWRVGPQGLRRYLEPYQVVEKALGTLTEADPGG